MGRVIGPYGVRGWIKVKPFSESPEALVDYAQWWLIQGDSESAMRVVDARMHGGVPIAHLEGVETREQAAALTGTEVAVSRDELPEIADDEVYWSDLPGCEVVNRKGEHLGSVAEVQGMAAHPVLRVVETAVESDPQGAAEHLIPLVPVYVLSVDLEAKRIEVDWERDF